MRCPPRVRGRKTLMLERFSLRCCGLRSLMGTSKWVWCRASQRSRAEPVELPRICARWPSSWSPCAHPSSALGASSRPSTEPHGQVRHLRLPRVRMGNAQQLYQSRYHSFRAQKCPRRAPLLPQSLRAFFLISPDFWGKPCARLVARTEAPEEVPDAARARGLPVDHHPQLAVRAFKPGRPPRTLPISRPVCAFCRPRRTENDFCDDLAGARGADTDSMHGAHALRGHGRQQQQRGRDERHPRRRPRPQLRPPGPMLRPCTRAPLGPSQVRAG